MNYQQHLAQGGERVLPELDRRNDGARPDVRCPVCSGWHHPAVVLNVAALPATLTGGAEWACDACWLTWKRERRPIDPGDDFVVPEEFQHRLFERLGVASQAELEEYQEKHVVRALRQRRDDLDRDIARAGALPELAAERARIHARAGIDLVASKPVIIANGVDSTLISGIPAGATVSVDGGEVTVNDGALELAASNAGRYTVRVTHPRKLPAEVTIDAS